MSSMVCVPPARLLARAALARRERLAEAAERKPAVVGAESRAAPRATTVGRHIDSGDSASAVPGDTLDVECAADGDLLSGSDVGDDRIDDHLGDRLVGV